MIPCRICGIDASTNWVTGLPPAPDSQKMALCAEHDTPQNRALVIKDWQQMLTGDIATAASVARHKAAPEMRLITVRFNGGGMLSFTGTGCTPTEHNSLRIDEADGSRTFVPLDQVREYTVSPLVTLAQTPEKA